jgi:hypothetical protein
MKRLVWITAVYIFVATLRSSLRSSGARRMVVHAESLPNLSTESIVVATGKCRGERTSGLLPLFCSAPALKCWLQRSEWRALPCSVVRSWGDPCEGSCRCLWLGGHGAEWLRRVFSLLADRCPLGCACQALCGHPGLGTDIRGCLRRLNAGDRFQ